MILELRNICKTYDQGKLEVPALNNVSLSVDEGEYLAIMGPSGSGKTTLMNIIGCLDTPTSGEYLLEGENLSEQSDVKLSQVRLRSIGFVFQSFYLLPRQSAVENVALPLLYAGVRRRERIETAKAALERVGLGDRMNFKPTQLSGGQCQRVAIARAIVNNPKLLLADEPTGALDTKSGEQVMEIFNKLNEEGVTIVMITHEPEIAAHAGRVLHIRDGRLIDAQRNFLVPDNRKTAAPADLISPQNFLAGARPAPKTVVPVNLTGLFTPPEHQPTPETDSRTAEELFADFAPSVNPEQPEIRPQSSTLSEAQPLDIEDLTLEIQNGSDEPPKRVLPAEPLEVRKNVPSQVEAPIKIEALNLDVQKEKPLESVSFAAEQASVPADISETAAEKEILEIESLDLAIQSDTPAEPPADEMAPEGKDVEHAPAFDPGLAEKGLEPRQIEEALDIEAIDIEGIDPAGSSLDAEISELLAQGENAPTDSGERFLREIGIAVLPEPKEPEPPAAVDSSLETKINSSETENASEEASGNKGLEQPVLVSRPTKKGAPEQMSFDIWADPEKTVMEIEDIPVEISDPEEKESPECAKLLSEKTAPDSAETETVDGPTAESDTPFDTAFGAMDSYESPAGRFSTPLKTEVDLSSVFGKAPQPAAAPSENKHSRLVEIDNLGLIGKEPSVQGEDDQ